MPATSPKQSRLMQAVAHNPEFAKKVGIPQKVGREFTGKKLAGGGLPEKPEQPGGFPKVEARLKEDLENGPEAPASAPSQGRFFTTPTAAEKAKSKAGPPAALLKKNGYSAGGRIDGCAQRGKTRGKVV